MDNNQENILHKIKEIEIISDVKKLNVALSSGWVLLNMATDKKVFEDGEEMHQTHYTIGWPHDEEI